MTPDTIKLLEENLGRRLLTSITAIFFLFFFFGGGGGASSPTVMGLKEKINKWYLIKLKSFCTAKTK